MSRRTYTNYYNNEDTLTFESFSGTGTADKLTQEDMRKAVGAKVWKFAQNHQDKIKGICGIQVSSQKMIHVSATVEDSTYYSSGYNSQCMIEFDPKTMKILRRDCNCYLSRLDRMCDHVAIVSSWLLDQKARHEDWNFLPEPETNQDLARVLNEGEAVSVSPEFPVHLEAVLFNVGWQGMRFQFQIGYRNKHMYVVKNVADLVRGCENHDFLTFGKNLAFTGSLDAFDEESQSLLKLLGLLNGSYSMGKEYGPDFNPLSRKDVLLQGELLDRFFDLVGNHELLAALDGTIRNAAYIPVVNEIRKLSLTFSRTSGGWLIGTTPTLYTESASYWYVLESDELAGEALYRIPRTNKDYEKALKFTEALYRGQMYVSTKDLATLSVFLSPLLEAGCFELSGDTYVPENADKPQPLFRVYLDAPDRNTIVGRCDAVYPDESTYNICGGDERDLAKRNRTAEQIFFNKLKPWFTLVTPKEMLVNEETKMYRLLKDGILALQPVSEVYVSDKLKRMNFVTDRPKVKVGVSVKHDLLQLDLVPENVSLDQLVEILNHYDPKKKFYRLKNGAFIEPDQDLENLENLRTELGLSAAQLKKGSAQLPKYRAYYLSRAQEEDPGAEKYDFDESFGSLVQNMKDTSERNYPLPQLNASLRPYQVEGFRWLCALKDNGFGGLLADEMGLGKTLETIAFLAANHGQGRTLIVCPASVVYNWGSELKRFAPQLECRLISGALEVRHEKIKEAGPNDVLITSYDSMKRDAEVYDAMDFAFEVIDEAQYIKNPDTQAARSVKSVHAGFRIALTGTPIENRLSELWSIFDYLLPGYLYNYTRFRDEYENPVVRDGDEGTEMRLKQMIEPFVLRRLKSDVLKDLPPKIEEVKYAALEDTQKQLYDATVAQLKLMLERQSDEEFRENKIAVLAQLTKLRQICCDPGLVFDHYDGNSAKKDLAIDMVQEAIEGGHKVLLFSQFTSMLDLLMRKLKENGINYYLLEGKTPKEERAKLVKQFQDPNNKNVPVFCISLKAGGTGLNLTAADIVIHYDPWWNVSVENQASDRVHRIGQKNVVTIEKLIMKDTVEERILQLQTEKSDLADRILSGDGFSSARLTRQDLLNLL
ncbi:MAG: DEAD/DEAH box helicase [Erysipelotrichaceae bacterium]|nr:DEAD/DEAH box helicase [Erysipelotrichaceae bacterium]